MRTMRRSCIVFILLLFGMANSIWAGEKINDLFIIQKNLDANFLMSNVCPSDEVVENNPEWVEHAGDWNGKLDKILEAHFRLPLSPVKPPVFMKFIPVLVDRGSGISSYQEAVWIVNRTNQTDHNGKNNNCHLLGMAAYYVEIKNKQNWPPAAFPFKNPALEEQWLKERAIGLIEFRWYDVVEKKRNRWFNRQLAVYLDWIDNYNYSPIFLPYAINTLN
jgi:hypothetical protein